MNIYTFIYVCLQFYQCQESCTNFCTDHRKSLKIVLSVHNSLIDENISETVFFFTCDKNLPNHCYTRELIDVERFGRNSVVSLFPVHIAFGQETSIFQRNKRTCFSSFLAVRS